MLTLTPTKISLSLPHTLSLLTNIQGEAGAPWNTGRRDRDTTGVCKGGSTGKSHGN